MSFLGKHRKNMLDNFVKFSIQHLEIKNKPIVIIVATTIENFDLFKVYVSLLFYFQSYQRLYAPDLTNLHPNKNL